jgi:uncharacterized protein (DUF169 family)
MKKTPLEDLLQLHTSPVAISFLPAALPDVPLVDSTAAASCGYWRRAADGAVFATEARHHLNCAVGAHTHGVPTTDAQKGELMELVKTMVGLEYLTMAEVPLIPQRQGPFGVVIYAPLAKTPCAPDVVLVRGDVRQLMLLTEAAHAIGIGSGAPTMGRPTCAVLPQAMSSARTSSSFGCVGNRVYTGLGAGEGYFAIPGPQLAALVEKLATIVNANNALEKFHEQRRTTIGA